MQRPEVEEAALADFRRKDERGDAGGAFLAPALSTHTEEIANAGVKASKTGVTFPPHKPVPDHLVTRLAQASSKHADD